MNQVLEALKSRRSIRSYNKESVPKEVIDRIVSAGTYAPTAGGKQSPKIVVVQDAQTIAAMSKLNAQVAGTATDPFYGASTVVIVFGDSESANCVQDGSLVMGNLMNAAYAEGVSSCWINRALEVFKMPEGIALKKKWGLADHYIGIGNCILGYTDDALPTPKPRKEDYVIYV